MEPLQIQGSGSCPATDAVRASIFQLTSPERRRALPVGSRVQVVDLGAQYRVTVANDETRAEKTFSDPSRECERRARFAAVFAVLTLMPPELGDEPDIGASEKAQGTPGADANASAAVRAGAASSATASRGSSSDNTSLAQNTPPAPPRSAAESEAEREHDESDTASARSTTARFELFGSVEQGIGATNSASPHAFSGELRALYSLGAVAPVLGFQYVAPTELELSGVRVSTSRLQASAGARLGTVTGSFAWDGELGVLVALQHARGIDAQQTDEGNALALGLRASGLVSLVKTSVGPVLELHASVYPAPPTVEVLPRGEVGKLPVLWLGASLGMFLGF